MKTRVYLHSAGVVSAAGCGVANNWQALKTGDSCLSYRDNLWSGQVPATVELEIDRLRNSDKLLAKADRLALLAVLAVEEALTESVIDHSQTTVIAGSARGATERLENEHAKFLAGHCVASDCLPQTTSGTLAFLCSRFIGSHGTTFSLSATCSTGLHIVGTALAHIRSGFSNRVLGVASETPLTPFVLNGLRATRVLAKVGNDCQFPAKPMAQQRHGLVVGEGAAALVFNNYPDDNRIYLAGYGSTTEHGTLTGVSTDGSGLALAINQALTNAGVTADDVQLIIGHGSATAKGDASEYCAYQSIWKQRLPALRFHKWCVGHMLGCASLYSTVMGYRQLISTDDFSLPYLPNDSPLQQPIPAKLNCLLVTSLGFAGNCAALVLIKE